MREMQAMGSQFMKRQSREQTEADLMLSVVLCSFSLVLFVVRSRTIAGMNRRRGIHRERETERDGETPSVKWARRDLRQTVGS